MLKIIDVLNMKEFKDVELIAGKNKVHKEVRAVNIVEVPEVLRWMKGREILFTTGYTFQDDIEEACRLIKDMHEKKISALAIKPGKYLNEIPKKMIDYANNLGFVLLKIPENKPYSEYMDPINRYIINKNSIFLEKINLFKEEIIPFIIDENYEEICKKVNSYTGKNIYCLNEDGKVINKNPKIKDDTKSVNILKKNINKFDKLDEIVYKLDEKEIKNGKKFVGVSILSKKIKYIIVDIEEFTDIKLEVEILHYLKILISMENTRKENKILEEINRSNELMKMILNQEKYDIKEIYERVKEIEFDISKSFIIFKMAFFNIEKINYKNFDGLIKKYIRDIFETLKEKKLNFLINQEQNYITILVNSFNRNLEILNIEKLINRIKLENKKIKTHIGLSSTAERIEDIPKINGESSFICKIAVENNYEPFKLHKLEDFGIYKILYYLKHSRKMNKFYYEELESIIEYDQKNNSDLLITLKAYFKNNGSLIETSRDLYVHKNTVNYRINKISEITGYDMSDYDTILRLYLSIKFLDVL
ncbi:PucR family transcriptional regulator [Miniphocaeibacter massiliensis]|uniref:PucR family transcriptional regulator n=1 Tax=Miniphocaeibacter massiliensis TaxID=2041841 RepID=UPI000C1C51BA|nr:PucR family transcriptional regulator [Miniphocaeibacter massiliensis]